MDIGVFLTELVDAKVATAAAIADLELRKKEKMEKLLAYEDKVASVEHAKVQFENVPVEYYDCLPLKPGVGMWEWLAKHVQTGKPLDIQIPDTVVLIDGHPTWLRSTKSTSIIPSPYTHRVISVPTSQSRWKRQFKREACPLANSPLSSLTREQLLTPVAVIRSHSHHQCSHASVVLHAVYDVMVKEHAAGSRPECVQAFVRNKGLKPCVYRVVWKRGKSSHALVMTSRHLFDKHEKGPSPVWTHSPDSLTGVEIPVEVSVDDSEWINSRVTLDCHTKGTFDVIKVSGVAITVPVDMLQRLLEYVESSTPAQYQWKFATAVGDFIKDEHDQWWFLQLKSFEVTEPCYRICRILSEAIQAAEENLTPYEFRTTLRAMGLNVDGLSNIELQKYMDSGRTLYAAEVLEVTAPSRQPRPQSALATHESKQASQEMLGRSCYLCGCVYSAYDTVESELKNADETDEAEEEAPVGEKREMLRLMDEARIASQPQGDPGNLSQTFQPTARLHLRRNSQEEIDLKIGQLTQQDYRSDSSGEYDGTGHPESPTKRRMQRVRHKMHARSKEHLRNSKPKPKSAKEAAKDSAIALVERLGAFGGDIPKSDRIVPMLGYQMTIAMMQELVSYMKRQGRLPSCFSSFDSSHTGGRCETVLRYSHRDVCRLCYDLYKRVSQMHGVSEKLARALCTPIPSQLPPDENVPLRNMSTLRSKDAKDVLDMFPMSEKVLPVAAATPGRKLGREARRNSDVIRMPRKLDVSDHGMLCRVPTSELEPTAQQYRLMIVFRHVEDIAWKRDDSQTEEGLDNFDAIDDRQRTCEIRYTLLNVEHKIQFTFTRDDVIANVQAVRLHYLVATDDAMQRWLTNDALSLDLFDVKGKDVDPTLCIGRSNLQFDRFCSGRKVSQEKQDMVLPMMTDGYGMVGLAISIGLVCDGHAQLSEAVPTLYTRGSGIFWPPESYHDFHALPDVWMGSLSALRAKQSVKKADPPKPEPIESSVTRKPFALQPADIAKKRMMGSANVVQSPGGKSVASVGTNYSNDGFDSEDNGGAPASPQMKRTGSRLATTVDSAHTYEEAVRDGVVEDVLVDEDCESVASGGSFSSIDSLDDIIDRYMFPSLVDEEVWEKKLKSTFMNLAGLDGCAPVLASEIVSTMYEELQAEVEAERVLAGKKSVLSLFVRSEVPSPHTSSNSVNLQTSPPKEGSSPPQAPLFQPDVSYSPIPVDDAVRDVVIATDNLDDTLAPPQPSPAPTPPEAPFQRLSNPNALAKWKFVSRKVREGCFKPGGLARRDHLPAWIHAKNVIEAVVGDSFNLALSEVSGTQSLKVPAVPITWRQLLCGIELYNSIRGSKVMSPGHGSVVASVLTPGHRDSHQRRAWRESVLEKLFRAVEADNNGLSQSQRDPGSRRVDIGELKSQLQWQSQLNDDAAPSIMCRWILADSDVQAMFQQYHMNASGTVSLLQLYDLAHAAFQWVTSPGHKLSLSEGGVCVRHGVTEAFSVDKYCVRCERKHVAREIRTGLRGLRPSELVHSNGKPHHRMFRVKSIRPPKGSGVDWSARTDTSLSNSALSLTTGGSLYKDALMGMLVGGKFKSATAGAEVKRLHAVDFLSKSSRRKGGKGPNSGSKKRVGWKGYEQPSLQSSAPTLNVEDSPQLAVVPAKPRTPSPDIDVADLLEGYDSADDDVPEMAPVAANAAANPRQPSPMELAPIKVTPAEQTAAAFRLAAGRSARPTSASSRRPLSASSTRLATARSQANPTSNLTLQPAYLHVGGDAVALTPKGIDKAIDAAVNKAIELEENRARERMRQDASVSHLVAKHRAGTALKEWQNPTADGDEKRLHEYWATDTPAEQRQALLNRRKVPPIVVSAALNVSQENDGSLTGSEKGYEAWVGGSTAAGSLGTIEERYQSDVSSLHQDVAPVPVAAAVSRSGVASLMQSVTPAQPNYDLLRSMGIDIAPKPSLLDGVSYKIPIESSFQWTALDAARAARNPRSSVTELNTTHDVWAQRSGNAAASSQKYSKSRKKSVVVPYWRPKVLEASKSASKVGWVMTEATMRRSASVSAKVNSIGDVVDGVKLQPIDMLLSHPRPKP